LKHEGKNAALIYSHDSLYTSTLKFRRVSEDEKAGGCSFARKVIPVKILENANICKG
jgi:hypothetical protein